MPEKIAMTPQHPLVDQVFWEKSDFEGSTLYLPPNPSRRFVEFAKEGYNFSALHSIDLQRPEPKKDAKDNPFNKPRVKDLNGLAVRTQELCSAGYAPICSLAWVRANLISQLAVNHYLGKLGKRASVCGISFPEYKGIATVGKVTYEAMQRIPDGYGNKLKGKHGFDKLSSSVIEDLARCVDMFFDDAGIENGTFLLEIDGCDCNVFFSPDDTNSMLIDVSRVDRVDLHARMLNEVVEA
jgi:hypothetical protein